MRVVGITVYNNLALAHNDAFVVSLDKSSATLALRVVLVSVFAEVLLGGLVFAVCTTGLHASLFVVLTRPRVLKNACIGTNIIK